MKNRYEVSMEEYANEQIQLMQKARQDPKSIGLNWKEWMFSQLIEIDVQIRPSGGFGSWIKIGQNINPLFMKPLYSCFNAAWHVLLFVLCSFFIFFLLTAAGKHNLTTNVMFSMVAGAVMVYFSRIILLIAAGGWFCGHIFELGLLQRVMAKHRSIQGSITIKSRESETHFDHESTILHGRILENLKEYCYASDFDTVNDQKIDAKSCFLNTGRFYLLTPKDIALAIDRPGNKGGDLIKAIRASTWKQVQRIFMHYLEDGGISPYLLFKLHIDADIMAKTAMHDALIEVLPEKITKTPNMGTENINKANLIDELTSTHLDPDLVLEHQRQQEELILGKSAQSIRKNVTDAKKNANPSVIAKTRHT